MKSTAGCLPRKVQPLTLTAFFFSGQLHFEKMEDLCLSKFCSLKLLWHKNPKKSLMKKVYIDGSRAGLQS